MSAAISFMEAPEKEVFGFVVYRVGGGEEMGRKAGPSAPLKSASHRMTRLWGCGPKTAAIEICGFALLDEKVRKGRLSTHGRGSMQGQAFHSLDEEVRDVNRTPEMAAASNLGWSSRAPSAQGGGAEIMATVGRE
ncbi:MAG TPA: hypothetical protein VGG85_06550 [Terracidiphilus sp.]|jgi:hypothetical protein